MTEYTVEIDDVYEAHVEALADMMDAEPEAVLSGFLNGNIDDLYKQQKRQHEQAQQLQQQQAEIVEDRDNGSSPM